MRVSALRAVCLLDFAGFGAQLKGVQGLQLAAGVHGKCPAFRRDTVSQTAVQDQKGCQRHVGHMIFPVHENDDRCVHGPSVKGAATLVTLCASALLILNGNLRSINVQILKQQRILINTSVLVS